MIRRLDLVLVGVLVGACSDAPFAGVSRDPCLPGNTRAGDVACGIPVSPYDSATDTYSLDAVSMVPLATSCDACPVAVPASLWLATTTPTGRQEFFIIGVRLAGGASPITDDPDVRYVVDLRGGPRTRNRAVDTLILASDGVHHLKGGRELTAVWGPKTAAWLYADGFDLQVARKLLPFPVGVTVTARVERRVGGVWSTVGPAPAPFALCWAGADVREDPCARR
jgi:hypothetical protein